MTTEDQVTVVDRLDACSVYEWLGRGQARFVDVPAIPWQWGPVGDGTWFAERADGRHRQLLPTAREAEWLAEYGHKYPSLSGPPLSFLHDARLKWAREDAAPRQSP